MPSWWFENLSRSRVGQDGAAAQSAPRPRLGDELRNTSETVRCARYGKARERAIPYFQKLVAWLPGNLRMWAVSGTRHWVLDLKEHVTYGFLGLRTESTEVQDALADMIVQWAGDQGVGAEKGWAYLSGGRTVTFRF